MVLTIPLSTSGKLLVKVGQNVDFTTPFFEQKITKEVKIFISQKIDVSPDKIFQYVKKLVGETVTEGETIAEKKSFMSNKSYRSEFKGTLKEINHSDGSILIEVSTSENKTISCYFKGEITQIEKGSLHLKVDRAKEYEAKEKADPFGGRTYYVESEQDPLSEDMIAQRVVIATSINSYNQMKMEALGAVGFATLHHLAEPTDIPTVAFKQIKEFEEAKKHALPYCFIDGKASTIVFYS